MNEFDTKRNGVPVQIIETGEEFNSIRACAQRLNADVRHVGRVSQSNESLRTVHGCHIVRKDEAGQSIDISKTEYRGRPGVPVQIIETGEKFDSISDCAKAIHGYPNRIYDVLRGKRKNHRGYHFKIIDK